MPKSLGKILSDTPKRYVVMPAIAVCAAMVAVLIFCMFVATNATAESSTPDVALTPSTVSDKMPLVNSTEPQAVDDSQVSTTTDDSTTDIQDTSATVDDSQDYSDCSYDDPIVYEDDTPSYDYSSDSDLSSIINRESGGDAYASNGQYKGIGQLSESYYELYLGKSWSEVEGNYDAQYEAMEAYVYDRYGSVDAAVAHSNEYGWY